MTSGPEQAADAARKAKGLPATQTPGDFYVALILKELKMGNFSKLIGGIVGSLVGAGFAYLAVKGLASCTNAADATTCSVLGVSEGSAATTITTAVTGLFVYFFPANKPV